jgi:DNA-binding transcriptional MerR regulator
MLYTVSEIARLAHVTVKTLHHYHKIGLLVPREVNAAGYRFYGQEELERLQEILFFRELDFSLAEIQDALRENADRRQVLARQRELLLARIRRLEQMVETVERSLAHCTSGEALAGAELFRGLDEEQWRAAIHPQAVYLKETYSIDLEQAPIRAQEINTTAAEAARFQQGLAQALRAGNSPRDPLVQSLIREHMGFLREQGLADSPQSFALQARFLIQDKFHRQVFEAIQPGLADYFLAAVEAFAGPAATGADHTEDK